MMERIIKALQVGVTLFWLAAVLSVVSLIPDPYAQVVMWMAGVVLLIHLVAYMLVNRRMTRVHGYELSFVKTMLFGITHWLPVMIKLNDAE